MKDPILLTLACCTWRRGARLRRLLTSIAEAAKPPVAWEVLVVDNDTTGATRAVAEAFADRLPLRYVFEPEQGSSPARNRAFKEARADLVVFVDDDVTIDRDFLTSYAAAMSAHPEVAFFGGPIALSFERPAPAWMLRDPRIVVDMFGQLEVDPGHLVVGQENVPRGANFAVRRSRAGGERFDAALGVTSMQRVTGDETLFLKRLLGAGAPGRWLPDAVVHRWIPPERTTLNHVWRHFVGVGRAQADLRACDDSRVAPQVVLGETPGAVVLRFQHAAGRLVLSMPSLFGYVRRASQALGAHQQGLLDFVVGHPRSGTNLITHVLNACGGPVSEHEYLADRTLLATLVEASSEHYEGRISGDEVKALIRSARLDPRVRIDSSWKNVWILPPLMDLYPGARFLHISRDPRNNVIACHNLDYYGEVGCRPEFDVYPMSRWLRSMPRIRRPGWDQLSAFEKNCEFWVETHRLILDTLSSLPGRYMHIRLEDIKDDEATLRIYRFFGLPTPPKGEIGRVLETQANPKGIDKHLVAQKKRDILPRFEACPAEIQATLRRICGPMAERLGYHI